MGFATDTEGAVIEVVARGALPVFFIVNWAFVGASDELWV